MTTSPSNQAAAIIDAAGGPENIRAATNCMTRVRIRFVDESKVDVDALKQVPGVMTVVKVGDQYQLVMGGVVDKVRADIAALTAGSAGDRQPGDDGSSDRRAQGNPFSRLIGVFAEIVSPVIPALLASAFVKIIAVVCTEIFGVSESNSTVTILHLIADSLYYFFPAIVGWSAARKFGADIAIGLMIIGLLMNPGLAALFIDGGAPSFLGIELTEVDYWGSVLPAILSMWVLAHLERFLRSVVPAVARSIVVPFVSLLVVAPLALLVLGPLGAWGGRALVDVFQGLYDFSPILAGALIGGTWQVLIIFGMHIVLLAIVTVPNIATFGRDQVIMTHAASLFCQIAAGLAVAARAKDPEIKRTAFTLSITSLLAGNVIEPVMYGVNIKYRRPFYFVLVGGAIGGAITGAAVAGTTAPVAFSLYSIPAYMGAGFGGLVVGTIVGSAVTFALTYFVGFDESLKDSPSGDRAAA
ncbi:PTS glucose transporter subunit IIB [Aeromicrobium camelliae]|uniref:PTS glucose transporter subunit IIB n=1 Tax=Aeromicrobium camelliae TaxID=1538144 RepID=A0A3N6WPR8_9ACTN|nr:PTS transporter subunit EIIC [Aeromicrobium camelliae]RQN09290.1 PTS glucose transporter subunit IIB [Aeromicrobium camelliae]